MKLLIDVSEEDYRECKFRKDLLSLGGEPKDLTFNMRMETSIADGIPLPKDYGELINIQPLMRGLYEEMCVGELTYTTSEVYKMLEEECPVIIEADKAESEG